MPKYGFFESSLSAANAVAAGLEYGQLQACEQGLFWVEYRPADGGRNLLIQRSWEGKTTCLTPADFSVRSGVYEYGGKSWCVAGQQVAFVNAADQQIWLQAGTLHPLQLTQTPDCRYGDLLFDPHFQRILAVQEQATDDPTQPTHRLIAVDSVSGQVTVLASGDDFYASPTLSHDGRRLAWISWDHPHMPWVSTRLNLANINTDGSLTGHRMIAGDSTEEAIQQPRFLQDNALVAITDNSGWWNLYRYLYSEKDIESDLRETGSTGARKRLASKEQRSASEEQRSASERLGSVSAAGVAQPVWSRSNDFGIPQWQLGVSTWDQLDENRWVAGYMQQGEGRLAIGVLAADQHGVTEEKQLASEYHLFRHICCFEGRIYCIASAQDRSPSILEITPNQDDRDSVTVITGGSATELKPSQPRPVSYPVSGETAYGFFYQPERRPGSAGKPPLIVFSHGGPTAATYPVYNPKIQFWTSRGFAVIDLNYRGSSGYGRDYRLRLAGSWGDTDWQDAEAAVDYLAAEGLIDAENVFIRGSSAGGYTTLCALTFSDRFKGGASYYGVSDPLALTRDTHKFESHYLDWLIGDPQIDADLYRQRSPLEHAAQIQCPMIFFQGGRDRVVVPQQTEVMVSALKQQNIPVEYHLYPEEQHGFRQADNQIHSLEAELKFYRRLLT
ncbi:alpha/beta hydrolase family protein [Amphritea pacifica]|uniref:S9 family peptidase n=1 Tax=Amphritea pacifica TaxID=2811233 RepID=A0ABS2W584_9GAMM|nr:S9 family peptidase [Amphritea pacifica]MBN0986698.1 S9 family peptidase [Amphritea pacifica]